MILQFGDIFDCKEVAQEITTVIKEKYNNFLSSSHPQQIINVVYFIWKNPWMVAANQTFINHLLEINKFNNVYINKTRYPEIDLKNLEKIHKLDVILLSSEPYPFQEKDVIELQQKFKKKKIILVDGEFLSWYGTRLINAFEYFKKLHLQLYSCSSI